MHEELDQVNEQTCQCGFPLQEEDEICVACLPPEFRVMLGRQINWYRQIEFDKADYT